MRRCRFSAGSNPPRPGPPDELFREGSPVRAILRDGPAMRARAGTFLAVLLGAILFPLPGLAQTDKEPSIHRPVTPEELERLKRQITEATRSNLELIGDYHTESGDLNNRLDFWRSGAKLNFRWKPGVLVYLSGVETRYMTRDDRFGGWGTNLTLGVSSALSDALHMQLEVGGTYFTTATTTINGLGSLKFAPSDTSNLYLTASRSNVEESLLSATGLRPTTGPFAGKLVGRVMENKGVAGGVVKLPYKIDAFAEGGLGTREGVNVGSNFFKQARAGAGYDVVSGVDDKPLSFLRVSYLLNYFGFDDDRLGFGGASLLTPDGRAVQPGLLGSDGISPTPGAGRPGVGGYFSPHYFVSSTGRIDLAGRPAPALGYRLSAFFGSQSYTDSPGRKVTGFSVAVDYILTDRLSIPVVFFRDDLGPFTQQTLSVKLVIKL